MKNNMLPPLEAYFSEVLFIHGRLNVAESFLLGMKNNILQEKRNSKLIVSAITTFRDLSITNIHQHNLNVPNYNYSLSLDNMQCEINNIVSQYCCFAVSQAYEAFESFLIELLTEYFLHNQDKLKTLGLTSGGIILIKETIRTMIKKQQKSNNKGLLSIVRKLSSYFRTHEASNMYHINISHWFDLISMIRHTLVHNRQIISNPLLKYLEKNKANLMFSEHFQMKKIGGNICIYLEQSKAYEIILRLNAFAYFIFKGLSIEARLSFETPDYIPQAWDESPFSW